MSIEHSILVVLSFWPSTGYDIKTEFEHEAAGLFWGASYGSIYPKLKKLEENGLIYALEVEEEGRKKKLYDLTEQGWKELDCWLSAPTTYPSIKDELFIKMAGWHRDMDKEILINQLLERKKQAQHLLNFVTVWPNNGISFIDEIGMLSIQYAQMRLETEVKWIENTIKALEKNHLPKPQDPNGVADKIIARRKKAFTNGKETK